MMMEFAIGKNLGFRCRERELSPSKIGINTVDFDTMQGQLYNATYNMGTKIGSFESFDCPPQPKTTMTRTTTPTNHQAY
jgi:hypothetical protein